jgi:UDP-glucose 4-epimerase
MRALVTGGAGFVGSSLVDRLLAEDHQVDVFDDLSSGTLANLAEARSDRSNKLSFHKIDVREPQIVDLIARRSPEVVFHLAAQPDVRVSVAEPALDADVNVVGTVNVLEGARAAGARKVVFASSGTIYGEADPADLPVRESHVQAPRSPLGVAKRAGHDYLNLYRALHGLEFTALALANVYGPRQGAGGESGVVGIFAGELGAGPVPGEGSVPGTGGTCTIFGDGEQTRDFVYVDDVVDAFVRSVDRGDGLLINVGTGIETSINLLYRTMARAADVDRPAVSAAARAGEVQRSALDPTRARMQLGWRPWTSLDDGTARVLDWSASRGVA